MAYKYIFDKENLVYIKKQRTLNTIFKSKYRYGVLGFILGVSLWSASFFGILESPKQQILDLRGVSLISKLSGVNAQFDSISNQLNKIQYRDDNFYRVISQLNPIPPSLRQQGFGGVKSFPNLEGYLNSDLLIESNKRGEIIEKQLNYQVKSLDTVFRSVISLNDSLLAMPAIAPMSPNEYYRISSPFGFRIHPISGKLLMHDGLDFAAPIGKPIHATGNGIVSIITQSSHGYGNRVTIKHGFGYKSVYAHMNTILVSKGDTVVRGQVIGTVGNTGSSTGPHLHYEIIYGKNKQNPANFYINDLTVSEFNEMLSAFKN